MFDAKRMEEQLQDFILDRNSLRRDEAAQILQQREGSLLPDLRRTIAEEVDALGGTLDPHAQGGEVIALPLLAAQRLGWTKQPRRRGTFDPEEALRLEELDFFAFGHPAIEQLLGEATAARPERLTTAYEIDGREAFEGVEIIYRVRTVGLLTTERILLARASDGRSARLEQVERLPAGGRSTTPETFTLARDPDALEGAIGACHSEVLRRLDALLVEDREAGERWLKRETDREQRIYAKRLAAAQQRVGTLTEDYAAKAQSIDEGDRRILPALRGRLEKAREQVDDVEAEHVREVERLQARVEPSGDFEVLAAALVRVVPPGGG